MLHKGNNHSEMHLWHDQQRTHRVEGPHSQKPTDSLRPNEPERAGSRAAEALGPRPVACSGHSLRGAEPGGACRAGKWPLLHKQYCSQWTAVNSEMGGKKKGLAPLGATMKTARVGDGGNRTRVVLMHNRSRLKRGERSESDRHIPQFNSSE